MADELLVMEANLKNLISTELGKIQDSLQKTEVKAKSSFEKMSKNAVSAAAKFIAIGSAVELTRRSIVYVVKTTAQYEASLSRLKAIVQPTSNEFDRLSKKALELGSSTKFTANEAASAFTALGQLGLNTNQILASSQGVLNLAASAQIDLASAAEMTASTLAQFKLNANQANNVVDIMAKSFNISALNAQRLQDSMKFAGVAAGNLGIGIEETTGALAALSKQNIVGTIAGTGLKNIMSQLYQENSKVGKAIGVTANDARTFTERLEAVRAKGYTAGQMMEMFGLEAGNVGIALVNNTGTLKEFTKELENASGTAGKMAETMQDNLIGSFTKLKSAIENAAISIGTIWAPAIRKVVDGLTEVVNGIFGVEMSIKGSAFVDAILEKENAVNELSKEIKILEAMEDQAQKRGAQAEANRIKQIEDRTSKIKFLEKEIGNLRTAEANRLKLSKGSVSVEPSGGNEKVTMPGGGVDIGSGGGGGGSDIDKILKEKRAAFKANQAEAEKAAEYLKQVDKRAFDLSVKQQQQLTDAKKRLKESEIALEQDVTSRKLQELQLRYQQEIALLEGNNEAKKILEETHANEIKAIKEAEAKESADKAKERRKTYASAAIDGAQSVSSAIFSIGRDRQNKESEMAKKRIKDSTMSEKEKEAAILKIEKEAFKRNKKRAIVESFVNAGLGVTKTIASVGFPAAIPLLIAQGIAHTAAVASILAQKFAGGGIVPGSEFTGDKVNARLNSGEMVLNRSQQQNMFSLLNGNLPMQQTVRTTMEQPLQVSFQVSGNLDQAAADRVIDKVDKLRNIAEDLKEAKRLGLLDRILV